MQTNARWIGMTLLGSVLGCGGALHAQEGAVTSGFQRLRTDHPQLRRLIEDAGLRSPTFGQLVRRLNESSVVVYITFGRCPGHVGACLNYQSAAAGLTYLRVTLDWFDHPPEARAGLLAHELTHALEVADARVTSLEGFRSFYERYGRHGFVGYETDEAAATGRRVELELAHELARR